MKCLLKYQWSNFPATSFRQAKALWVCGHGWLLGPPSEMEQPDTAASLTPLPRVLGQAVLLASKVSWASNGGSRRWKPWTAFQSWGISAIPWMQKQKNLPTK